jgi:hypothetical protein
MRRYAPLAIVGDISYRLGQNRTDLKNRNRVWGNCAIHETRVGVHAGLSRDARYVDVDARLHPAHHKSGGITQRYVFLYTSIHILEKHAPGDMATEVVSKSYFSARSCKCLLSSARMPASHSFNRALRLITRLSVHRHACGDRPSSHGWSLGILSSQ